MNRHVHGLDNIGKRISPADVEVFVVLCDKPFTDGINGL